MSSPLSPQLQELVSAQLATGRFTSEEEVLLDALQKQQQLQQEEELEDDWPAIKEALDKIEAGDQGQPAEEVFDELRKKHSL
jgi:Arc/MetJ-type ribon-helix-helix transcriptional regulator